MLNEREMESCYLGQFIPVHYHHNMLMDQSRMQSFKAAIKHAVFPGAKVLELGGGTGVLSWFAAAKADKVWCVELNPDLVKEARRMLARNMNGQKVEVVHADAFDYLPPEPVDVVICEMIHVGLLREKQVEVLEAFKHRYLAKFGVQTGNKLPVFLPEAVVMAVQPMQQPYDFHGFYAPIVQFQGHGQNSGSVELAAPCVYGILDFSQPCSTLISWKGDFTVERSGTLSAFRFITKNVLAIRQQQGTTIDWLNHYMVLPLEAPIEVRAGDQLRLGFEYRAGATIPSLQNALRVELVSALSETENMRIAYA